MCFDILGAMGETIVKTPNIDTLLREGMFFKNAHCPSPICAPSIASVKTGKKPTTYRMSRKDILWLGLSFLVQERHPRLPWHP